MKNIKHCPACHAPLRIGDDRCAACGAKVKPYVPWWLYVIGVSIMLILMLGFGDPAGMVEIYKRVIQSFTR